MPGQQAGEDHQRIGSFAVARKIRQPAENDGKHNHREEWPDERPSQSNDRLLISNRNVPPGENIKEMAKTPKITPIMALGESRFNGQCFKAHDESLMVQPGPRDKYGPNLHAVLAGIEVMSIAQASLGLSIFRLLRR